MAETSNLHKEETYCTIYFKNPAQNVQMIDLVKKKSDFTQHTDSVYVCVRVCTRERTCKHLLLVGQEGDLPVCLTKLKWVNSKQIPKQII